VKLIYDFKSNGVKGKYIDAVRLYTIMYYDRYPVHDMTALCEELNNSALVEDGFDSNCTVGKHEVMSAVHLQKSDKLDGSDYFLNACDD